MWDAARRVPKPVTAGRLACSPGGLARTMTVGTEQDELFALPGSTQRQ